MAWFDLAVLVIVGLSLLLGLVRGVVRELLSLISWLVALLLARQLASAAAAWLPASIQPEGVRHAAGFVLVVVGVLLALGLLSLVLSALVKAAGLSFADRVFGAIFGLVRGLLIVFIAVLVAGLTGIPREPGWRGSVTASTFEAAAAMVQPWLPAQVRDRIKYF